MIRALTRTRVLALYCKQHKLKVNFISPSLLRHYSALPSRQFTWSLLRSLKPQPLLDENVEKIVSAFLAVGLPVSSLEKTARIVDPNELLIAANNRRAENAHGVVQVLVENGFIPPVAWDLVVGWPTILDAPADQLRETILTFQNQAGDIDLYQYFIRNPYLLCLNPDAVYDRIQNVRYYFSLNQIAKVLTVAPRLFLGSWDEHHKQKFLFLDAEVGLNTESPINKCYKVFNLTYQEVRARFEIARRAGNPPSTELGGELSEFLESISITEEEWLVFLEVLAHEDEVKEEEMLDAEEEMEGMHPRGVEIRRHEASKRAQREKLMKIHARKTDEAYPRKRGSKN